MDKTSRLVLVNSHSNYVIIVEADEAIDVGGGGWLTLVASKILTIGIMILLRGWKTPNSDNTNMSQRQWVKSIRGAGSFEDFHRVVLEWTSVVTPQNGCDVPKETELRRGRGRDGRGRPPGRGHDGGHAEMMSLTLWRPQGSRSYTEPTGGRP